VTGRCARVRAGPNLHGASWLEGFVTRWIAKTSRCLVWVLAVASAAPAAARASELTVEDAIRSTWQRNPGLAAGLARVQAAQAEAAAARDAHLPTFGVKAQAVATDEPAGAFALKLDQQRITAADFAPARLNAPDHVGGVGLGATVSLPIYAGGQLSASRDAARAVAESEASGHERRRQEAAVAVVEAYFGAQLGEEGLRHANDRLESARETERFTRSRNAQGLALDADVARASAARAEAEADRATALQRLASARSALALLSGDDTATTATLVSRPEPGAASGPGAVERPDLRAARLAAEAARDGVAATRASLLPQVGAQASVETMRSSPSQGATWTAFGLVARWQFAIGDVSAVRAASAKQRAAEEAHRWQERQALREVEEARRAVETADRRVAAASEAMTASVSARTLRKARFGQGLLPLVDVLDAETGLAGARALLLRSKLEARVARAQLALALGEPVEGVTP
jgi:outer membrane protein TolC